MQSQPDSKGIATMINTLSTCQGQPTASCTAAIRKDIGIVIPAPSQNESNTRHTELEAIVYNNSVKESKQNSKFFQESMQERLVKLIMNLVACTAYANQDLIDRNAGGFTFKITAAKDGSVEDVFESLYYNVYKISLYLFGVVSDKNFAAFFTRDSNAKSCYRFFQNDVAGSVVNFTDVLNLTKAILRKLTVQLRNGKLLESFHDMLYSNDDYSLQSDGNKTARLPSMGTSRENRAAYHTFRLVSKDNKPPKEAYADGEQASGASMVKMYHTLLKCVELDSSRYTQIDFTLGKFMNTNGKNQGTKWNFAFVKGQLQKIAKVSEHLGNPLFKEILAPFTPYLALYKALFTRVLQKIDYYDVHFDTSHFSNTVQVDTANLPHLDFIQKYDSSLRYMVDQFDSKLYLEGKKNSSMYCVVNDFFSQSLIDKFIVSQKGVSEVFEAVDEYGQLIGGMVDTEGNVFRPKKNFLHAIVYLVSIVGIHQALAKPGTTKTIDLKKLKKKASYFSKGILKHVNDLETEFQHFPDNLTQAYSKGLNVDGENFNDFVINVGPTMRNGAHSFTNIENNYSTLREMQIDDENFEEIRLIDPYSKYFKYTINNLKRWKSNIREKNNFYLHDFKLNANEPPDASTVRSTTIDSGIEDIYNDDTSKTDQNTYREDDESSNIKQVKSQESKLQYLSSEHIQRAMTTAVWMNPFVEESSTPKNEGIPKHRNGKVFNTVNLYDRPHRLFALTLTKGMPTFSYDNKYHTQKTPKLKVGFTEVFNTQYHSARTMADSMNITEVLNKQIHVRAFMFGGSGVGKTTYVFGKKNTSGETQVHGMLATILESIPEATVRGCHCYEIYGTISKNIQYGSGAGKIQSDKAELRDLGSVIKRNTVYFHQRGAFNSKPIAGEADKFAQNTWTQYDDLDNLIASVDAHRVQQGMVRRTPSNPTSSRSALIYTFEIVVRGKPVFFQIVDLPGYENYNNTDATLPNNDKDLLKEGNFIRYMLHIVLFHMRNRTHVSEVPFLDIKLPGGAKGVAYHTGIYLANNTGANSNKVMNLLNACIVHPVMEEGASGLSISRDNNSFLINNDNYHVHRSFQMIKNHKVGAVEKKHSNFLLGAESKWIHKLYNDRNKTIEGTQYKKTVSFDPDDLPPLYQERTKLSSYNNGTVTGTLNVNMFVDFFDPVMKDIFTGNPIPTEPINNNDPRSKFYSVMKHYGTNPGAITEIFSRFDCRYLKLCVIILAKYYAMKKYFEYQTEQLEFFEYYETFGFQT